MSEYMEKHAVSKLIGSPPGYVGHEEGGQLTERIRRQPYSIVLFDEIEKAHPDVPNLLLQILEDGMLTDSYGNRVDFRHALLILTSNLGTSMVLSGGRLGFSGNDEAREFEQLEEEILGELRHHFTPEFINRIDELIVFNPLGREELPQDRRHPVGRRQRQPGREGAERSRHTRGQGVPARPALVSIRRPARGR